MEDKIIIRGAREHNLKNVDITLPRNKLVVLVGREDCIEAMVRNNHIATRFTTLRQQLAEAE